MLFSSQQIKTPKSDVNILQKDVKTSDGVYVNTRSLHASSRDTSGYWVTAVDLWKHAHSE